MSEREDRPQPDTPQEFADEIKELYLLLAADHLKVMRVRQRHAETTADAHEHTKAADIMAKSFARYYRALSDDIARRVSAWTGLHNHEGAGLVQRLYDFNLEADMIGVEPEYWRT